MAGFGRAAAALERRLYRPERLAGAIFTALCVGAPVAMGVAATVGCWAGRSLRHEANDDGRSLRGATCRRPDSGSGISVGGTVDARRARDRARDGGVGGGEHLRRGGRPAGLGCGRRAARPARLPRGEHSRRDGGPPQCSVRPVRHPGCPPGRPAQPGAGPADRAADRGAGAAGCGGGTATTIPAPTPGSARRRWPARWAYGWAGATCTSVAWRCVRSSVTGHVPSTAPGAGRPHLPGGRAGDPRSRGGVPVDRGSPGGCRRRAGPLAGNAARRVGRR